MLARERLRNCWLYNGGIAEPLDSPRRKAEFERANREDALDAASRLRELSIEQRLEAGIRLNHVAFEFANAVGLGPPRGRA